MLLLLATAAEAKWVFLVHVSGDETRWATLASTYCCRDAKWIAFGERAPSNMHIDFVRVVGAQGNKTAHAFRYALEKYPNVEYITKLDDDTYFYVDEHVRYVTKVDPGHAYYGYLNSHWDVPYASGGAGYTLHVSMARHVVECTQPDIVAEDYYVGKCLYGKANLRPVYSLHAQHPEFAVQENDPALNRAFDDGLRAPQSFHYVTPFDMHQIYTGGSLRTVHHVFSNATCADGWEHEHWNVEKIQTRLFRGSSNKDHPRRSRGLINARLFARSSPNVQKNIAALEILMQHGGVFLFSGECMRETPKYDSVTETYAAFTAFSPAAMRMVRRMVIEQRFPGWDTLE